MVPTVVPVVWDPALRRVAPLDSLKSEKKVCVVKIDFFQALKWPTIVANDMANAPTAWDTHNNTLYHTPDANMTSLSIRHDRTDERGRRASALAQRTAAARASRDQDMHSPCPCAIEASCRPSFVATLASHCPRRTSAQAHTRAHVSINMTCSDAWLQAVMRGCDTNGVQREQR